MPLHFSQPMLSPGNGLMVSHKVTNLISPAPFNVATGDFGFLHIPT